MDKERLQKLAGILTEARYRAGKPRTVYIVTGENHTQDSGMYESNYDTVFEVGPFATKQDAKKFVKALWNVIKHADLEPDDYEDLYAGEFGWYISHDGEYIEQEGDYRDYLLDFDINIKEVALPDDFLKMIEQKIKHYLS